MTETYIQSLVLKKTIFLSIGDLSKNGHNEVDALVNKNGIDCGEINGYSTAIVNYKYDFK